MESSPNIPAVNANSVEQAKSELGGAAELFQAGKENLVAGLIISFLLIGGAIVIVFFLAKSVINAGGDLPFWSEKDMSWGVVALGTLGILVMLLCALGLILYVKFLSTLQVFVCRNGFFSVIRLDAGKLAIDVFRWDQIESVQETVKQEYLPLKGVAKYAAPAGKARSYVVNRKDGKQFTFDGDSVKKVGKLARILQRQLGERGVPWNVAEQG
jgi:hypothetical protein